MQLQGRTVLITGGASGLGLSLAAELLQRGNQVIVVGRSESKLAEAKAAHPLLEVRGCDVSRRESLEELARWAVSAHPALDVLVNNAGVMNNWDIPAEAGALDKPVAEVATNLVAPILLTALLVKHLQSKSEAAVVNVSSGAAFLPVGDAPVYGATKAALHSYTQSLRYQLRGTSVKVVELIPPTVESPMSAGRFKGESRFAQAIPVAEFLAQAMRGLERGDDEILVGRVGFMRWASRWFPGMSLKQALATKSLRE
ncbi:MAG: SDR family NAD(P)-dependent oxidoreductase [Archangiaceae bacterium]|nr:SDR family NAD(P)-dependent oxidoreductase [Archangiaceae bacterium]